VVAIKGLPIKPWWQSMAAWCTTIPHLKSRPHFTVPRPALEPAPVL